MKEINNSIRLNVMLHDDWEIYGDGSGNPEKLMFDPAKRILDICDKYDAKYTFFAEFGQQLSMLNSTVKQHKLWANTWESILSDAIARGHDVQLHFHPQWIGGYFKNGKWELDFSKWSIAKLDEKDIFNWLEKGKDYIENLLIAEKKDFKIVSFRAGGWHNQPSEKIYIALKKLDLKADVSIRKGIIRDYGPFGAIDFSYAPSELNYWYAHPNDFAKQSFDENEIISIPTYSQTINNSFLKHTIKNYPLTFLYYLKIIAKMKFHDDPHYSPPIVNQKGNSIYCNFGFYHHKMISDMIKSAINKCIENDYINLPFIMVTHSKNFYSFKNFEKILKKLKNNENTSFITTQNQITEIFNKSLPN